MSNFDALLAIIYNLKNYPILISIFPILFSAIIYLLGKIRVSNSWQYYLENKYIPPMQGIVVLNKFLFIPLAIIVFSFNWKTIAPLIVYLLSYFVLLNTTNSWVLNLRRYA